MSNFKENEDGSVSLGTIPFNATIKYNDYIEHVTNGLRFNGGKPQLSYALLGKEVVEGECKVWEYGANKYAPGNWLKGQSLVKALDSVFRHASALLNGEDLDPETGLPHCDHLVCAAKIVSQSFHTRPDLDDRVKSA